MSELARVLSIYTGMIPVRDVTGLTGEYKLSLWFTTYPTDLEYPVLEEALPSQLGLVLRRASGEADFLIVDSIARPTAN